MSSPRSSESFVPTDNQPRMEMSGHGCAAGRTWSGFTGLIDTSSCEWTTGVFDGSLWPLIAIRG
ncbi:MAG: hypothetical protein CMJ25_19705 [Phycisphaerae bacterium]|nr:hypothetical protein [Phycisphaerae bacterium]